MNDTIAAISTALGGSALAMVRLSGTDAISVVQRIFKGRPLATLPTSTAAYGHVVSGTTTIDEVVITVFRAPKSFTTEDLVEITCHGGAFVTRKILSLLLENGARLALPGEFTKRAYLNGRIDLTQAEAVMDIIASETDAALKMANNALSGQTKQYINSLRDRLLQCILEIEVNIDYPEYEDEKQITSNILLPNLLSLKQELEEILRKADIGKLIQNGIKTAIIGKPNVGKSSLLNALLKEDRAIVTDIAGTTRDTIEAGLKLGGVVLKLIDTAGIRETQERVEQIGILRAKKVIEEADLVILVFDYSAPLDQNDAQILDLTAHKKRIIVVNKQDLAVQIDLSQIPNHLLVSSFKARDIERLEKAIQDVCLENIETDIDYTYLGSMRQIEKVKEAKRHLEDAIASLEEQMPIDIANIDIRSSYDCLSMIVGEATSEALHEELFKRFCLGK
ncbi:MAG: tRNA uridine-5-carboxymethylaminomethyl(34) synthesis GTPase MnmE [Bacilli bacterium]|nr:tRNA uridine-5-carboxymethylaminomethyl(34) synthesis GTPase MnmE [Bacilli bacterium]